MDERARVQEAMRPRVRDFEITGLGKIYLRALTAGQRDRFAASVWEGEGAARKQNLIDANARLVSMVWADEDGKSLGLSEQDVAEMDGGLVGQLADAVVEMNGLGKKAVDDVKAKLLARPDRRLLFRIAREVGKSVEEVEQGMSSAEVAEWLAIFMLEADEQRPPQPHG